MVLQDGNHLMAIRCFLVVPLTIQNWDHLVATRWLLVVHNQNDLVATRWSLVVQSRNNLVATKFPNEKKNLVAITWSLVVQNWNNLVATRSPSKTNDLVATWWSLAIYCPNNSMATEFLNGEKNWFNCHQVVSKWPSGCQVSPKKNKNKMVATKFPSKKNDLVAIRWSLAIQCQNNLMAIEFISGGKKWLSGHQVVSKWFSATKSSPKKNKHGGHQMVPGNATSKWLNCH